MWAIAAAFGGALVSFGVLLWLASLNTPREPRWRDDELHGD